MARESICTKDFDSSTGIASWEFSDGDTLTFDLNAANPEMRTELAGHGVLQKGGDSYAGVKGDVAKAKENLRTVLSQLLRGEWTSPRAVGESGFRIGDLAEALSRLKAAAGKEVPVDKIREALTLQDGASDEQKAALKDKIATLKSDKRVKAMIAKIQLERATAELEAAPTEALPEF